MIDIPSLQQYGPGMSDSPNRKVLRFDSGVDLYFSYETPVGLYVRHKGLFLKHNRWSHSTGRHLRLINDLVVKPTPVEDRLTETGFLRRWLEYAVFELLDLDWVKDPVLKLMLGQALAGDLVSRAALQDYLLERI